MHLTMSMRDPGGGYLYISLFNDPVVILNEDREGGRVEGRPAAITGPWCGGRSVGRSAVPFVVHGRVIMKSYFTTYGNYDLPPRSQVRMRAGLFVTRALACTPCMCNTHLSPDRTYAYYAFRGTRGRL